MRILDFLKFLYCTQYDVHRIYIETLKGHSKIIFFFFAKDEIFNLKNFVCDFYDDFKKEIIIYKNKILQDWRLLFFFFVEKYVLLFEKFYSGMRENILQWNSIKCCYQILMKLCKQKDEKFKG